MFNISKAHWYGRLASALLLTFVLAGCATTARNTTSVVDYLYPNKEEIVSRSVPVLTLPLRVGIAFVPGNSGFATAQRAFSAARPIGQARGSILTEQQKLDVMKEVANHFRKHPFVKDIQVIPTDYLTPRGSFQNLDQIRAMYGVDEIVLLSYDQTQFTDEGFLSITYWTIVGAYLVQGEKNDTQTMVDAVVYDIPSRKLLFRAPGTSLVKGSATYVNQSQELRRDSETGVRKAVAGMIENLDVELAAFRARVRENPADYTVIKLEGYRGDKN